MAQLQPVRPITVFQAVFDQLSALLATDAFASGDRLPSERELAEQLQVSRPVSYTHLTLPTILRV